MNITFKSWDMLDDKRDIRVGNKTSSEVIPNKKVKSGIKKEKALNYNTAQKKKTKKPFYKKIEWKKLKKSLFAKFKNF